MKTIAYPGMEGSFSYLAALQEFGEGHILRGCKTFKAVFEAVDTGQADYGVVPIENSLIGSIYENYDLFGRYDLRITAEQVNKIEHCLLTLPQVSMEKIVKVLSHPKALAQCAQFFQDHPWMEAVVMTDTATAAAEVSQRHDPTYAAIASNYAGKTYGLEVANRGIEDDPQNYTRFIVVQKKSIKSKPQGNKCSLMMVIQHVAGTLADVFNLLARHQFNITKIESRPYRGNPFEYIFYLDFEFNRDRWHVDQVLDLLSSYTEKMKILGFYNVHVHGVQCCLKLHYTS